VVFKKGCKNNCELYKGDLQAAKEGPHKNELESNNVDTDGGQIIHEEQANRDKE